MRNAYLAEQCSSGHFHRILAHIYDVPLVTEVTKSQKMITRHKSGLSQMEEDLLFGTANLPAPGSEEGPGRVTQGAAWHMLSECYLTQAKFQPAVDAASEVIDGYNYALMTQRFGDRQNVVFGTGDPYYDLFALEIRHWEQIQKPSG
jgi:hypothetical protein